MKRQAIIWTGLLLTPIITAIIFRSLDVPPTIEGHKIEPRLTEILIQRPIDRTWQDSKREQNEYNDQGLLIATSFQTFKEKEWRNAQRMEYTFNEKDLLVKKVWYSWKNEQWLATLRFLIINDDAGRPVLESIEQYKDNKWATSRKVETQYSGDLKSRQTYSSFKDSSWTPSWKDEYDYRHNLLSQKTGYRWIEGSWKENTKTIYAYDDQLRFRETASRFVDGVYAEWRKVETFYELGDRIASTRAYLKKDNNWVDQERKTYIYN